jgi:hypothetical protein
MKIVLSLGALVLYAAATCATLFFSGALVGVFLSGALLTLRFMTGFSLQ